MSESVIYRYAWGPRLMGFSRKGQPCRVLVRGKMNSALIEFEDGPSAFAQGGERQSNRFRAVVSRNALRRAKLSADFTEHAEASTVSVKSEESAENGGT